MPKKIYAIGLDAGVTTGVCVFDRRTRSISKLFSSSFWEAYAWILQTFDPAETLIVVEKPRKNFVYDRNAKQESRVLTKIAFNAGENNREATLLIDGLEKAGFEVKTHTPDKEKWDAATFRQFTRMAGRTNEHERDAARLVWGI